MWKYSTNPKPRFYLRAWFLAPVLLLVIAALAGGVLWFVIKNEYEVKAAAFDMSKLEDMDSASTIYDRNNNVMGRIYMENRDEVALKDLPYMLVKAVIAAEDNRFYQHHGVDYYGMFRAAVKNWRAGRIRQGASTLTQQLARNSYPKELPSSDRSFKRKILEAFVAQNIETYYEKKYGGESKGKILELYLNRVYFGSGFYGAEAAALGYFGKHARDLNLSECATLAGLLKNPNNLSPWSNRQACIESRNFVLGRMLELNSVTREEYNQAENSNLPVKNRRSIHAESYANDLIRQQVIARVGLESAVSDGYRIYTTVDIDLQKKAEESLRNQLRQIEERPDFHHQTYSQYDTLFKQRRKSGETDSETGNAPLPGPEYLQGAFVALDNATGGILALIGGRDFNHSQYNRVISSARPAGTAFIPFVYAAAFQKGFFPGTLLQDAAIDNRQVMIGGVTGILGEWGPEQVDNKYEGPIPAREALVKSKNAATVRLGMQTGIDNVIALAMKSGISSELRRFPATYLGSSEVTLLDLTLAYTIFPNSGIRPEKPFIISRIEDRDGNVIFSAAPDKLRVIPEQIAYEVHSCLTQVLERGTAALAFSQFGLKKFPVGGKTGTAYNFTDDWFFGYDSAITCGVWAGFDKPQPIYRGAFSNEVVLPVWVDVMNSAFAKYKPREIAMPSGLRKYEICLVSGQLATDVCNETTVDKSAGTEFQHRTTCFEIATDAQAPRQPCTVHGNTNAQPIAQAAVALPQTPSQWPRAELAVDVKDVKPVMMQGPTISGGDDPYNSVKPMTVLPAIPVETPPPAATGTNAGAGASPTPGADQQPPPAETEVRRAEPARPFDQPVEDSSIKLEPPPPMDFSGSD